MVYITDYMYLLFIKLYTFNKKDDMVIEENKILHFYPWIFLRNFIPTFLNEQYI